MIYLDNNATTHIDPLVFQALCEAFSLSVGNPSSPHSYGRAGRALLQQALTTIAAHFKVKENRLIMTSGATEALNLLIQGFSKGGHIITSQLEHPAVLEPLQKREKRGFPVTYLQPKNGLGAILPEQIEEAITPQTTLIVLMGANNETGIMTDLHAIAELALKKQIFFLVDGVALLGKGELALHEGVSAICFSGHKIHAPTGVGFAIVKKEFPFDPQIVGGPQARGKRGGTENLPGICALAKAVELLEKNTSQTLARMETLRNLLEGGIISGVRGAFVHGKNERRVSNTSNICFPGIDGETLLIHLDMEGVAVSLGSACSAGGLAPSRVLLNMGVPSQLAKSSLRFSLSRFTTEEEIKKAIQIVIRLCATLTK